MLLTGCARMFTATTEASYIVRLPDGTVKEVRYKSDKEQIGLDAAFDGVTVKVDKSSTQDAVIAATLQLQAQMLRLLESIAPAASKAAAAGS